MVSYFLTNGEFPFWNPYSFSGMPFFAHIEIAVLYPFNLLLSLFMKDNILSPLPIQISILFHILICSFGSFYLAKQLGLKNVSAVLLAIIFPYSSYFLIHLMHMANIEAVSWLPWIFAFWIKFVQGKKYRDIFAASGFMSLSILCGYPQVSFFNYFFIAIFALVNFIYVIREKIFADIKYIIIGFVIFVVLPLGVASVQLLPTNEFVTLSNRASFDYEFAKQGSVYLIDYLTFFMPKIFGVWNWNETSTDLKYWATHSEGAWMFSVANIYTSVLTVFLLIPAIYYFSKEKTNKKLFYFLLVMTLFSLLFALGGNFFLQKLLFDIIPFFDRFRNPGHILYIFCFSVSIIVVMMFNSFIQDKSQVKKILSKKYLLSYTGVIILFFFLVQSGFFKSGTVVSNDQIYNWIKSQYVTFLILSILTIGLFYLFITEKINLRVFSVLIILIVCIDIYYNWFEQNNGSVNPEKLYNQNSAGIKQLQDEQQKEIFRVNMREGSNMIFQRNQGMKDRVQFVEGYGALHLQRYSPVNKPDSGSTQTLDLLNVKYKINTDKVNRNHSLIINPGYLPRAKMFYDVKVIGDEKELVKYMESKDFNYRNTLVLEKNPGNINLPVIKDSSSIPKSSVTITRYTPHEIDIEAEASENGFLFLSEVFYPVWKAYIDGKETEIFRTDYSLRSVYLEKGKHKVEFQYEDDTFRKASYISIFSVIVLITGLIFFSVKSRKNNFTQTNV